MKKTQYNTNSRKRQIDEMTPYAEINPQMIQWANTTFCFTTETVAELMHTQVETIRNWETGSSYPTYAQLETLAYDIYRIPVATFFLSSAPIIDAPKARFRTSPGLAHIEHDYSFVRIIRKALAKQIYLSEIEKKTGLLTKKNGIRKLFGSVTVGNSPNNLAKEVRGILSVTPDIQSQWKKPNIALDEWRHRLFLEGIYVFKEAFRNDNIAGFCVGNENYPVIYINNSTTKTRQIFTVFHELAHLILQNDTIDDMSEIENIQSTEVDSSIEIFCNRFAGECLVPSKELENISGYVDEYVISQLASRFGVSREVILRKLVDRGLVSQEEYIAYSAKWISQIQQSGSGGYYYNNQLQYLGKDYISVVLMGYRNDKLDRYDLKNYLGVNLENIAKIEKSLGENV